MVAPDPFATIAYPGVTARGAVRDGERAEGFVMVCSYHELKEAARDWGTYSSDDPGGVPIPHERNARDVRQIPIEVDPPLHSLYRDAIAPWFGRSRLHEVRPRIERVAASLASAISGTTTDVVRELALPVVNYSLALVLGRPLEEAEPWMTWGKDLFPDRGDGRRAPNPDFTTALETIVDEALENHGGDLFGTLAATPLQGRPVTRAEMIGIGNLLFAAGRGTVIDAIAGSVWHLARNDADRARLASDSSLVGPAVEEFLRYFSPLTHIGRTTTQTVTLGTDSLPAGSRVSLGFAFANRDPEVFDEPQSCLIGRHPNRHVAFGHGPHTCLGAQLARIELSAVLAEILAQTSSLRLVGEPQFRYLDVGFDHFADGFETLNVAFDV